MLLQTIFAQDIKRPIEGVIKADDEARLGVEIREYVLTNEVEKRLESFLEAYNGYQGANGVWVSGFFGSGKSHMLKMLALLLENREVDGEKILQAFLQKCRDNEILRGELRKAVAIPSKSILFNIDQKADVISKTQIDALLAVFVKVFDEMSGYYGKQGHIAQFERDLDSRGLYASFQDKYEEIAGRTWQKGREQALLEGQNIARAYAAVTGSEPESAIAILDKYRNQYRVSIEDFADQVKAYLDKQSPDFRLNFFVDEVGQYIAENVKLMTNLQTIAESLATKCQGRSWIIVTAQEDMDSVVGEMNRQQSNDFSKIQARFHNRMMLTSQDVAEVIQKRLLTKTDEVKQVLASIYQEQANNFKTLFDFTDGSQTYRNFQDCEHFTNCYPFIPYQFTLFQAAIQNLSKHNAFTGKHSSVGERSMLAVFQLVAIQICDRPIGKLATFDLMFEGIRTALKSSAYKSIRTAEQNLDNQLAIRILRTLFLVKYINEFKSTLRNLCVLMLDEFNQDLPQLSKDIEEALDLLEQQNYIQRDGEQYVYLTDEEQDIEQEIKNTEVEFRDVADDLEKIIFDYVIKNRKIRNVENNYDYEYSRKLDGRLQGREHELTINVITPFHENAENEAALAMQSMGFDELLVIMPADSRLMSDLMMYKRTEKYIRQNVTISKQEGIKRILEFKASSNRTREAQLKESIKTLLGQAKLYVAGTKFEVGGEDAQSRIIKGFQTLIERTYPNLKMLRGISYSENDLGNVLNNSQEGLFGNDVTTLEESEQEVLAFIQGNNRTGIRTTLKLAIDRFRKKPYGWYEAATLCTIAKLSVRGKLETKIDSNILEGDALEKALRSASGYGNVILEPQIDFTTSQVRNLKEFYQEFFDASPTMSEAKALGKETGEAFQELLNLLTPIASQVSQYPFLQALDPAIALISEVKGKSYAWYLTELSKKQDDLLDLKEQVIAPIRGFMNGNQREIYEQAQKFVQVQEPNFAYIASTDIEQMRAILADRQCFKGNRMQQVKVLSDRALAAVDEKVKEEIAIAKTSVTELQTRLCAMSEFTALNAEQQAQIVQPFSDFLTTIINQSLIAVIRDARRRFEEEKYAGLMVRVSEWAEASKRVQSDATKTSNVGKATGNYQVNVTSEPPVEYVAKRSIQVKFDQAWLENEADVDRYLAAMREAFMAEIQQNKRISI
ncbi:hypothetical protein B9G53_12920 [Pseudanabaena sp. SR411]|uniref:BREX system P-loop protein BrxC n=1 Tax=Pseudanabaena sp. SR411 TaxID=1980935 RepID=UPI000B9941F5|nr:BREX system P-loop protein BrxC [Pseudanabaena sp. SR411]OYQ64211.1 hypothetical protein B9G53_12920 [Pseudanabaena sp. SR411]